MPGRHLPFGITQRFLLFFFLTAILPILIVGSLLFHEVNNKLSERLTNLLKTGQQLSLSICVNDLEKLELVANQAAFLSINETFRHYLVTEQSAPLEGYLNRLQRSKNLDIVALLDGHEKIVANTRFLEDTFHDSFHALIQAALAGRSVSTIEQFTTFPQHQPDLYYISVVPVVSEGRPQRVIGALMLGQSMRHNFSFQNLKKVLPALDVRIYQQTQNRQNLLFSSLPNLEKADVPAAPFHKVDKPYEESVEGIPYKSLHSPLHNFQGEVIGSLLVSAPETNERELNRSSALYIDLYLLLGVISIAVSGLWFNRSFVSPMNEIAEASAQVATGDLSVRVQGQHSQAEMKRTIRHFNRMLKQLEETEQLRSTFISTLTHDFRTPLLAEKRVLETFEDFREELPAEFGVLATGLLKSNDHLLNMVNQLLETYKYEAGKIPLDLAPVDLAAIVNECFTKLFPLADSKQITLSHSIPVDFAPIEADAPQIRRVLINLIANAIENIPNHKQIKVEAQAGETHVEVQICDNGPGISAKILPNLFDRYATGHRTQQKIGSGLGLYICRLILENHGGSIGVTSQEGHGTTFQLFLPKAVSSLPTPKSEEILHE